MQRRGFSLIELMVTLGIIGIIAAVAIPAYARHRSDMQLRATVDQVAAALKQAQSTARSVADGAVIDQNAVSNLPVSTNRFTVYAVRGGAPTAVQSGEVTGTYSLAVATSATNDVTNGGHVDTVSSGGGSGETTAEPPTPTGRVGAFVDIDGRRFWFQQDGTLCDAGQKKLTLSNGSRSYEVVVSSQGTVSVVETTR